MIEERPARAEINQQVDIRPFVFLAPGDRTDQTNVGRAVLGGDPLDVILVQFENVGQGTWHRGWVGEARSRWPTERREPISDPARCVVAGSSAKGVEHSPFLSCRDSVRSLNGGRRRPDIGGSSALVALVQNDFDPPRRSRSKLEGCDPPDEAGARAAAVKEEEPADDRAAGGREQIEADFDSPGAAGRGGAASGDHGAGQGRGVRQSDLRDAGACADDHSGEAAGCGRRRGCRRRPDGRRTVTAAHQECGDLHDKARWPRAHEVGEGSDRYGFALTSSPSFRARSVARGPRTICAPSAAPSISTSRPEISPSVTLLNTALPSRIR